MKGLLLIIFVGAAASAINLEGLSLSSSVLILGVIGITAYLWDTWIFTRQLQDLLLVESSRPSYEASFFMVTSLGQDLRRFLDLIHVRLQALSWELNRHRGRDLPLSRKELLVMLREGIDSAKTELELYEQIILFAKKKFRCQNVAVILFEKHQSLGRVIAFPTLPPTFEAILSSLHPASLAFGNSKVQTYRFEDSKSLMSELSLLGTGVSIFARFFQGSHEKSIDGLLWLGYQHDTPPTETETLWIRELVEQLENELDLQRRLYALRERVIHAEESSRERGEFLAHMSHDLRAPLSNIQAILNLFQLESQHADRTEMLEAALANCECLSEIMGDLLLYYQHHSGQLQPTREVLDVSAIVQQVVSSFLEQANRKGLELNFSFESVQPLVLVDKHHIRRVLFNLIGNAIKYTSRGGVRVCCEASTNPHECLVVVEDSGSGLNGTQIQNIFEPFTRFHEDGSKGMGLGLCLSRVLVELNGGSIQVTSVPGKSTRFELVLPRAPSKIKAPLQKVALDSSKEGGELSVLVVDDDRDYVETISRGLDGNHWQVSQATSVSQALELYEKNKPDVVVTDSEMPGSGGKDLIRELMSRGHLLTFIVLSGREESTDYEDYRRMGVSEILRKPVNLTVLKEKILCGAQGKKRTPCVSATVRRT